ncbi:MAG: hypothetical protein IPN29_16625 [Saprospiraceae bacterium]|nr:hypothetical protein [Saprospiraceae bacterium]
MKIKLVITLISIVLIAGLAFSQIWNQTSVVTNPDKFLTYWYDGKAEVASYSLIQNRYGELHNGHAVLIFVTEDFSKTKQVKLDHPEKAGKDKQAILKLNMTKQFNTGIYPYSILNSVFTPVDGTGTIKTSCSVQEWCGHTFTQLNRKKEGFAIQEYSYFEEEGDKQTNLPLIMPEDELWTQIRINPGKLPEGKVQLIRGSMASRLMHLPLSPVEAIISKQDTLMDGNKVVEIAVGFEERTLKIYYEPAFPHTILGWDETYGEMGKSAATTKARLKKIFRLPYWQLHNNEHLIWRDSLGLN